MLTLSHISPSSSRSGDYGLEVVFSKAHVLHEGIFYDRLEGKYYDKSTDMFLEYEELEKFGLGC